MKKCSECNGTGEITIIEDPENGVMDEYYYECYVCNGTGEIIVLNEVKERYSNLKRLWENDHYRKVTLTSRFFDDIDYLITEIEKNI